MAEHPLPTAFRNAKPLPARETQGIAAEMAAQFPYIDPADMPDLYAITGKGRCMEPLFNDGSLLVGSKREKAKPGDTVIVFFRREIAPRYGMPGWVKRLVHVWPAAGEDDLITLEQLNPPRRYIVPASHVAAMHKCVGTAISQNNGTALYRFPKRDADMAQSKRAA